MLITMSKIYHLFDEPSEQNDIISIDVIKKITGEDDKIKIPTNEIDLYLHFLQKKTKI